ncbi:hypothetical protein [Arundinibacter roseus]|uniref:Uncharacterized protein n=1 Tax=Arundinibacter roseus TaxID=2070510 RepID=A0A4R4KDK4_9BACT|nr:hypothetical protein [Arundinibacter roseus]TDB64439.1 hypothetical protein EZE20_12210 [Arundinibacter roseus]
MKIFRSLILLVFGLIWIVGCSTSLLNELYRAEVIPDDYRFGDLYRLSNLPQFKDPKQTCPPSVDQSTFDKKNKVAFYIIGDSFAEAQRMDSSDFVSARYQYAHWGTLLHLKLDTTYTNIVLLESVERTFREHFTAPISNVIPDTETYVALPAESRLVHRLDRTFAAEPTEDRLSSLLFQFDSMLKIKELKSWITYNWFERTDPKVTVSPDGSSIAYYVDTDSSLAASSFITISNGAVDTLVNFVNTDKEYLLSLGFDDVWLSVIPNKATILMPDYGTYNHLIERIEKHPALSVPVVSVIQEFSYLKDQAYLKGDSHWSCVGQELWLKKVNAKLLEVIRTAI